MFILSASSLCPWYILYPDARAWNQCPLNTGPQHGTKHFFPSLSLSLSAHPHPSSDASQKPKQAFSPLPPCLLTIILEHAGFLRPQNFLSSLFPSSWQLLRLTTFLPCYFSLKLKWNCPQASFWVCFHILFLMRLRTRKGTLHSLVTDWAVRSDDALCRLFFQLVCRNWWVSVAGWE